MEELFLCSVEPAYLRYLYRKDNRVSVKFNNRPFVGVITIIGNKKYLLPLTSQTTQERKKRGKKKRSAKITTFVRDDRNIEIANILYNNMIPVKESVYSIMDINPMVDTYEAQEIRFIRKNRENIVKKANTVYRARVSGKDNYLNRVCNDFSLLDQACKEYKRSGE